MDYWEVWTTREVNHVAVVLDSCANHGRGLWRRGNPYSLDDARRLFPSSRECDPESRGCRICPAGHKQRRGHTIGFQHYVSDIGSMFGMTYRWPSQFCTEPSICSGFRFALFGLSLQWCHNERDDVSNHRRLDCLLSRFFRRRSKKTSKLRGQ